MASDRMKLVLRFPLLLVFSVMAGLATICLWLHYHDTPDFDTYVRTMPVSSEAAAARWPAAEVLARGPLWQVGDIDPFAIAEDDPHWRVHHLRFTATVTHGDEVLSTVVQELAVAASRTDGDRGGAAVRASIGELDPRMRVAARVWIDDEDLIGPGSARRGRALFDVMVLAGSGANELSVARLPRAGLAALARHPAGFEPSGDVHDGGLIHELRREVHLTWEVDGEHSTSAYFGELATWVSTPEYSRGSSCKLEDIPLHTSSSESSARLAWEGLTR